MNKMQLKFLSCFISKIYLASYRQYSLSPCNFFLCCQLDKTAGTLVLGNIKENIGESLQSLSLDFYML